MSKRLMKQAMLFSSLLLVLAACDEDMDSDPAPVEEETSEDNSDESVVEAEEETEEETQEAEVDEEDGEEPTSDIGRRTNPVPLGESITFDDTYRSEDFEDQYDAVYEIAITDVVRGEEAWAALEEENSFNEPAPEGMEWIIISLEGTLHEGDEDVPYTVVPWFSVVDSTGSEVAKDDYASLSGNTYGHVDLFPGGLTSGRITKYIPEGDDSLLVMDEFFASGIYFSLSD